MSDNPLQNTPERAHRIRERAYHLWEADGRPLDRDKEFWERAEILIGMEDSAGAGQLPNPQSHPESYSPSYSQSGHVVEEAEIQENYGEFPGRMTDQGERRQTPKARTRTRKAKPAATQGGKV